MFPEPKPYLVVKGKQKLLYPRNINYGITSAMVYGGVAVSDVSEGIHSYVWSVHCVDNRLYLCRGEEERFLYIEVEESIKWVDLAFDINMNTVITYSTNSGTYLRYYSTVIGKYDTIHFTDIRTPSLLLDSNADYLDSDADVIFMYFKGSDLFYRVQKERYTNEYLLYSYDKKYMLWRTGHTADSRLALYVR